MIIKKLLRQIFLENIQTTWNIGFVDFNPETILNKGKLEIRWMKHQYRTGGLLTLLFYQ